MSLKAGQTWIVTGASSGIGRALSMTLASEGIRLVLNARRGIPLEETAKTCRDAGAKVEFLAGSAASEEVARRLAQIAIESGNFHGMIHVAGVLHPGPLVWELSNDQFEEIFESSVTASFQIARAVFPYLEGGAGGVAVFFGSGAAEMVVPGMAAYCAAKAAEEHLARQLAAEARKVSTFVFRPGMVDTPMVESAIVAQGSAAKTLREQFRAYRSRGELLSPDIPAKALVSILKNNPQRFHGRVASWRDGI